MKIRKNGFLKTGGIMSLVLAAVIVAGFFWTPYGTTAMNAAEKTLPPSLHHLLGTDNFGRDVLSRVISGAGTSFLIALGVVAVGCISGVLIGSLCGYFGGIADAVLMRVCDAITAFPAILLALVVVSLFGGGMANILLCLGLLFIPSFARVVRTEVARVRDTNYIQSARLMGVSTGRILLRHILPNTFPVLLPAVTIGFNNAVLAEASMSFLGVGIQPPQASLGSMLKDSQTYLNTAPWYALGTGGMIVLLVLAVSLLSEGIQQGTGRGQA
ncbi:ABC transporter permease [Porcincola intestinalis]|uniref:ABC transporter permease n=1 Tax=Porcincola intestinalis TaxID=2606632 RepID=UPI0023F083EC|nr:ABC transporter permease [Porcincola intestinalis]MCI6766675.1 ABC transporter permease [Lachnospiraceae bacterium]MDD7060957.1 ABC transporter permease [Porcincola intestinalis]MDY5283388.1 ABC transporter permease [Porcincola intestinalis]MDY5578432.1 ABC transporter permease [Porcincola intestinalis]